MGVKVSANLERTTEFRHFVQQLGGPGLQVAAAKGLNEHAAEQRRQSIVRVVAFTGIPRSRMAQATTVKKARPGPAMQAVVQTADKAIGLHEYGNPVWVRDLNPMADGHWGGSVSSMRGAEATAWNVRRQFPGSFIAGGKVRVRVGEGRFPLRTLSGPVLANELAKPDRPNVPKAEAYLALDLERRVVRHIMRSLE